MDVHMHGSDPEAGLIQEEDADREACPRVQPSGDNFDDTS